MANRKLRLVVQKEAGRPPKCSFSLVCGISFSTSCLFFNKLWHVIILKFRFLEHLLSLRIMGSQVTGGLKFARTPRKNRAKPSKPLYRRVQWFLRLSLRKHLQRPKGLWLFFLHLQVWHLKSLTSRHRATLFSTMGAMGTYMEFTKQKFNLGFSTPSPWSTIFSIILSSVNSQDCGQNHGLKSMKNHGGIAADISSGRSALDPESHRWLRESLVEVVSKEQSFTKQRAPIFWGKNRPVWARCEILKFCQRKIQLWQRRFPLIITCALKQKNPSQGK